MSWSVAGLASLLVPTLCGCAIETGGDWDAYAAASQAMLVDDLTLGAEILRQKGDDLTDAELLAWLTAPPTLPQEDRVARREQYGVVKLLETSDGSGYLIISIERFHDALFEVTSWGRACSSLTVSDGELRGMPVPCPSDAPSTYTSDDPSYEGNLATPSRFGSAVFEARERRRKGRQTGSLLPGACEHRNGVESRFNV